MLTPLCLDSTLRGYFFKHVNIIMCCFCPISDPSNQGQQECDYLISYTIVLEHYSVFQGVPIVIFFRTQSDLTSIDIKLVKYTPSSCACVCVQEGGGGGSTPLTSCDVEENVANQEAAVNKNMHICTASKILTVVFNFIS